MFFVRNVLAFALLRLIYQIYDSYYIYQKDGAKVVDTLVYAGRIRDQEVLAQSSSGGAFTVLSDFFLDNNDAVLCTGYNYSTDQAEQRILFDKAERDKCKGSIYMQSYALQSWKEAIEWLKKNPHKKMIFFGLGCQGAAFDKVCVQSKIREQVTIIDIICHGVPSPLIWKEYIKTLRKNGTISDINLRDKRNGWSKSIGVAKIDGKEISLSKWRRLYSSRTILRPCCSVCPYTTVKRKTDITIGDFWGLEKSIPEFYNEKGTSIFLVHTEKGATLFDAIKDNLDYRDSDINKCLQPNLIKPTQHAKNREKLWKDYEGNGIDYVMNKYGKISIINRVVRFVKNRCINVISHKIIA